MNYSINPELINNIDLSNLALTFDDGTNVIKDNETKIYQQKETKRKLYLIINSHPYSNGIYLYNPFGSSITTIYGASNKFTITYENGKITIKADGQSNSYLFDTGLSNL